MDSSSEGDGPKKERDGYRPGPGPGSSEAGGGGTKLTIIASKDLEDIRAETVDAANENAQLRHQLAMLEKRLADAEYHARLYWQCGMKWARQELQWVEERERLLGRVRVLQQRMLAEQSLHECGRTTGRSEAASRGGVVAGKSESAGGARVGGDEGGGDSKRRFFQPVARDEDVMVENGQNVPPGLFVRLASSSKVDMVSCKTAQSDASVGNVTKTNTSIAGPASKGKEMVETGIMSCKAAQSDASVGNVTKTNPGMAEF